MKRLLGTWIVIALAGAVMAQGTAPFTIVRPADGSKVREDVHVLFPKNSVAPNGYVGIFINGKFIEAVVPETGAKFLDYTLHTKDLDLPDGPTTIEAVLYMNFDEKPRIIDRSSVQVTLANKASIPMPDKGYQLRYRWQPGHDWVYDWQSSVVVSTISEAQAKMGGHAAQVPVENHDGLAVYSMDNVYPGGDALVRIEAHPPKGKDSFIISLVNDPLPKRVFDLDMYPVYMRLQDTGREVYGVIPKFWDFNGAETGYQPVDILFPQPLPSLPIAPVKPNDSWQTRFQMPSEDDANGDVVQQKDTLVEKIPARGEFEGVEWEMGHPCAKIHNSLAVGSSDKGEGINNIKANAQSIDETFWYALDRGVVVKLVRSVIIDRKLDQQQVNQSMNGGGTGSPGSRGDLRGRGGPRPQMGGGRGSNGSAASPGLFNNGSNGVAGRFGRQGTGSPGDFAGGGQGLPPGAGQRSGGVSGGGELYRITMTEVFTLLQ